jgi:hypothetical protein
MTGLNQELRKVRMPSGFSRRTRPMEFGHYKAEEWRNISLYLFQLVFEQLTSGLGSLKRLWMMLGYLTRAYTNPDNEFAALDTDKLFSLVTSFYLEFEKHFEAKNCR